MMSSLKATGKKEVTLQFLYKNKCNVKMRGSLNLNNIQAVGVYFSFGTVKLSMTCVYIPPNANTIATFDILSTYLAQYVSDPQSLHVPCGHFNVNFLSKGNKQSYLRELTQTFDLKLRSQNLITRETKISVLILTCSLQILNQM